MKVNSSSSQKRIKIFSQNRKKGSPPFLLKFREQCSVINSEATAQSGLKNSCVQLTKRTTQCEARLPRVHHDSKMSTSLNLLVFLLVHTATSFHIKKYSDAKDWDCVLINTTNLETACKLIDSSEDRKISMCDGYFVKVLCDAAKIRTSERFRKNCISCTPESNKFLVPAAGENSFVSVVTPSNFVQKKKFLSVL